MRERERLDDFQGGAVACRGCKQLLYFDVANLSPLRCCAYAYVPSPRQVDLYIYDKLAPGEWQEAALVTPMELLVIAPTADDEIMEEGDEAENDLNDPPLFDDQSEDDEDEEEEEEQGIDILVVTAEQVEARKEERMAQLKRRGQ